VAASPWYQQGHVDLRYQVTFENNCVMAETATYGWMIAYGGRGLVCSTRCSVCVKGSLCARGRIALGFLACAASNEASSRSNMHGIPITPQRWQPSESPANFSQRLFCFLHALHALEDLGRFGLGRALCDASPMLSNVRFIEPFSSVLSMEAVQVGRKVFRGHRTLMSLSRLPIGL